MQTSLENNINNRKVCIIGSGYVGASITYALMMKELAHEIVLIDTNREKTEAEVLDIRHGIPYIGSVIIKAGDYSDLPGSNLIIITAGRNRRPGESRLDMASDNVKTTYEVKEKIEKYYTSGVILVVSNPNDIITYKMTKWFGLPPGMVFGTGCTLDNSRFVNVIADYVALNSEVISAQIIGEHGDTQVPLWSKATIAGIHIKEYCETMSLTFNSDIRKDMENKVLKMGSSIIRGKQRTHYGISTCVCYIADAVLNRRATIACVTSVLDGEYGINNVALSLPTVIKYKGATKRMEEQISDFEHERLLNSANIVREALGKLP